MKKFIPNLLLSLLFPFIACAIQWFFWDQLRPFIWFLFYPAAFFSSQIGGRWGGMAATLLSAALAIFLFVEPVNSFKVFEPNVFYSVTVFILMGFLFGNLHEKFRREQFKSIETANRRQAEQNLHAEAERLSLALDAAQAGTWEWDLRTNKNTWSNELWKVYGLEPHSCEPSYEAWQSTIHPEDRLQVEQAVQTAAQNTSELRAEWRVIDPDGKIRWLMSRGKPILNAEGKADRFLGVVIDITERKQTVEKLSENEEHLRLAYEATDLGGWKNDLQTGVVEFDERARIHYGFDTNRTTLAEVTSRVHPDDVTRLGEEIAAATGPDGSGKFATEYRVIHPDGSIHWLSIGVRVLFEGNGHNRRAVIGYGTSRDITEKKQAEEKIQQSEEQYRYLFENNPHPMWSYDQQTLQFLAVNDSAIMKYGYSRTEFLNMTIADIRPAEDIERLKTNIAQQRSPLQHSGEWRHRLKDGTIIDVEISSHTLNFGSINAVLVVAQDVTERRKIQQELIQSNERFTQLANNVTDVFWISEPITHKILYISPTIEMMSGKNPNIFLQLPNGFLDLLLPEDRHIFLEAREKQNIGMKTEVQYRIQRADRNIRWIRDKGSAVYDENGKIVRVVGIARDLTEQVEAEMQLKESESRFRQLAENIAEIFWMFDYKSQQIIYIGPAYESVWGRSCESLYKHHEDYLDSIIPEDQPLMFDSMKTQLAGETTDIKYRIQRPDGTIRWIWDRSFPIFNEVGELIRTAGVATDISEIKKAQLELENLNRTLEERVEQRTAEVQDLYDNAPSGYHSLDDNGMIIMINQTELQWLGYAREELLGVKSFRDLLTQQSRQVFDENFPHLKSLGWLKDLELDVARKDGSIIPVLLAATAIYDSQGNFLHSRSTISDITERKLAENALRTSEERLNFLLANTPAVIFTARVKLGMPITFISNSARDILGYEPHQYLEDAEFWLKQVHPDDLEQSAEAAQSLLIRGQGIWESRVRRSDGKYYWISTGMSLLRDKNGQPTEVIGYAVDINDKKQAEEALQISEAQLRQSRDELSLANVALEKASRLKDEFLASMSHELRTPLTGILGLSEALQSQTYGELNEKQSKVLKTIEASGRHLLELINDILDLSKIEAGKLELQFEPCSLADVCQASLQLIKGMAQQKHQTVNYSPLLEPMMINADARRLKQILVNLLSNAVKFTPEMGELGLEISTTESGQSMKMAVWDKGIGIKTEDIQRLFSPFMQIDSSLAREYSGTGLGLSLVQRLVSLHNGSIELESVFGEGSRFTVTLPSVLQNTFAAADKMQSDTNESSNLLNPFKELNPPKIFVVDDNEVVLQLVTDYLEAKKYQVSQAHSGLEFLEQVMEVRPNAIIMDIQMPGMNGLEVIRFIRAHSDPLIASTPVVAVTALAMSGDRERCLEAGANEYMSKPVKLMELVSILQKLIGTKQ